MAEFTPGQKYRHHTGEIWEIVCVANSCIVDGKSIIGARVVYTDSSGEHFTVELSCAADYFSELITVDGIDIPRLTLIEEDDV